MEGRRRIRKAEATFRETDAVWAKVAGPDSSESSVTEVNLGNLLAYEGRYPQAEGVLRNALRISRLHYPETSKQVRFARFRLANTLAHVGKSEEAITLVQVLLDGPAPESDYEHYILGASQMAFAEASLRLNRSDRALSAARSALEQMKALRPLDNTNIGRAQFLIGRIEIARGKRDEAKTTLREAVATLAQEEDADADPRMLDARITLAETLAAAGKRDDARAIITDMHDPLAGGEYPYKTELYARLRKLSSRLDGASHSRAVAGK